MTGVLQAYPPRIAVHTSVLMEPEWLRRLLLATDVGLLQPIWSPQGVGELATAGLWRLVRPGPGRRSLIAEQYATYRAELYRRIDQVDLRFEIVTLAGTPPLAEEMAWAEDRDPHDLHVQLLARTAIADCVVSWNDGDFPARQDVDGRPCGELCGVLWITPDRLPALRLPAAEEAS